MVDGAGFEPASSARNFIELTDNKIDEIIGKFSEWLEVDELRKRGTIQHHVSWIKRLLKENMKYPLNIEDYRSFLKKWKSKVGVYHYSNLVKAVRVFTRFLGCEQIGRSFKFPRIDRPIIVVKKKAELRKFYYEGLQRLDDRTFFLLLATSGLRRHEAAELRLKDIDLEMGMVIPNSGEINVRGTKNTFVTFINSEAKSVLKQLIASLKIREDDNIFGKGFGKSGITYRWKKASKRSGIRFVPQMLREWFCNEMGRLGVADRYIDAVCGRVPRSILARHYTDYSPEQLKQIYDKADLKVLG